MMQEQRNFGAIGQQVQGYARNQYADIAVAPVRALPDAIERLGTALKEISGMADTLRVRLEPVTSPPPPQSESAGYTKDCQTSSSTVAQVHQLHLVAEVITAQLQDVLNRLEV